MLMEKMGEPSLCGIVMQLIHQLLCFLTCDIGSKWLWSTCLFGVHPEIYCDVNEEDGRAWAGRGHGVSEPPTAAPVDLWHWQQAFVFLASLLSTF